MLSLTTVPLNCLRISALNVRTTDVDAAIPELAASIDANGLLQNLIVVPLTAKGLFGVVAGGRRYRALQLLVEQGRRPADVPVPVLIEEADEGRAASLEENIRRIAMNPADEVIAFRTIVDEHADCADPVATTARRFAVTEHYVHQRLKLARLAPAILDAVRAGEIPIGAAQAYAGFDDQDLQLSVFRNEQARQFGSRHEVRNIRDALRGRTLPASDRQARFVGLDAYVAAGGRVDRDLFMGQDEGERLLDPAIVEKLARAKAEAQLSAAAKADGFKVGILANAFTALPIWPNRPPEYEATNLLDGPAQLTAEDRARSAGLYTLAADGSGLVCQGWWYGREPEEAAAKPPRPTLRIVTPAVPAPEPAPTPTIETARPGDALAAEAARRREDRLGVIAAHLAVERAIAAPAPEEQLRWPEPSARVAAIEADPDDEDVLLVAVQIRVTRAELEALLPQAGELLEEEESEAAPAQVLA